MVEYLYETDVKIGAQLMTKWKPGMTSFAEVHPELVEEWNFALNSISPFEIRPASGQTVWWLCQRGHAWEEKIYVRARGRGKCKKCSSILYTDPKIAKLFHPTLNGDKTAEDVTRGENTSYAWLGEECGHPFWGRPSNLVRNIGCGVCNGTQVAPGINDLQTLRPDYALQWHSTLNLVTPDKVTAYSSKQYWWQCQVGHAWEQSPSTRYALSCAVCEGRILVKGQNDLCALYPTIASQWHPIKNNGLTPTDVVFKSTKKVWWLCALGHDYETTINARVQKGVGCKYCSNQAVWAGFNDLATTYPRILRLWDYESNTLLPTEITAGSNRRVNWFDARCSHGWEAQVREVAKDNGTRCPYCAGHRVLPGFNDLATIAPWLVEEWDWIKNKDKTPQTTLAEGKTKIWWICRVCAHSWDAIAHPRIHRDVGCPKCKLAGSKIQRRLHKLLEGKNFDLIQLEKCLPVKWNARYGVSWVDTYIEHHGKRYVVEYDGGRWHEGKEEADHIKSLALLAAGYRVIRVRDSRLTPLAIDRADFLEISHTAHQRFEAAVTVIDTWIRS